MSRVRDDSTARILAALERQRRAQRWVWLAIAAFVAVAVVAVIVLVVGEERHAQRVAAGRPAVARVERLQEGFCWVGVRHSTCMDIELSVSPAVGAAFTTVVTHSVADRWKSRVQPGQWLSVIVDADDPTTVLIDDAAFERPPPAAL